MSVVTWLNGLPPDECVDVFMRCCGSSKWAHEMAASRPFADIEAVHHHADVHWALVTRDDVMEAFSHHPKIGASMESLREKFAKTATWSAGEQQAVGQADEAVLERLRDGNVAYEARFGYIFIVCATGKTAAQMLELLEARLSNAPDDEFAIAKGEQAKITHLRIDKLEAP